ncbi:hypothetical protein V2J09_014285 [Rumex salicifolius]
MRDHAKTKWSSMVSQFEHSHIHFVTAPKLAARSEIPPLNIRKLKLSSRSFLLGFGVLFMVSQA